MRNNKYCYRNIFELYKCNYLVHKINPSQPMNRSWQEYRTYCGKYLIFVQNRRIIFWMLIYLLGIKSTIMIGDPNGSTVVTDAVHHRLVNQSDQDVNSFYECYNCCETFSCLENLAEHVNSNNYHSQQMCLKCKTSITVFFHNSNLVLLHSCVKSSLRHLNSDLYVQSRYIASKLQLSENISTNMPDVACDIQACPETFAPTVNGIYKYLKHANKYFHSSVTNCRKCSLPEFRMVVNDTEIISHFCIKIGKPVCVMKS